MGLRMFYSKHMGYPKPTIRLSKMPRAAAPIAFRDKTWRLPKVRPYELNLFYFIQVVINCP